MRDDIAWSGRGALDLLIAGTLLSEFSIDFDSPGHFLDIGANDPRTMSNTWSFYQAGWRGLAIDALAGFITGWAQHRPADIFINAAVGECRDRRILFRFPCHELSTLDPEIAASHAGLATPQPIEVDQFTMDSIMEQHWPSDWGQPVFASLDVEGHERPVLEGWNLTRWRPRVICVESIYPNTNRDVSSAWEDLLLISGYRLAAQDAANKLYAAIGCS